MQNQKLCLKWNNHMSNMLSLLGSFQQKDTLVDVTISCQGQNIKAHKIILSACSPYFQNIFMENPCQHPIIIINGMKFDDITAILNFMYKGEVNVSHDGLSSFLQAAEALKVKGLAEVCGEKKGTNSISQEVQQSELNRPQRTDTPPRKRPRNRKRSLSDSNRSDDEGLSRKHREPSSPEVHELSGDESFTGDNSSNGPPFNSISRVPQNVYSRSHQSSSNMGGEDDDEYDVVESNKMLDTTDSNVSMNNTNTDNNLRIERIMGNATEIESSSMADPESPPDIKPIINFGESSAGPSESGNLMLYNEQSQPGPSNVQDSSLLHDNSHAQDICEDICEIDISNDEPDAEERSLTGNVVYLRSTAAADGEQGTPEVKKQFLLKNKKVGFCQFGASEPVDTVQKTLYMCSDCNYICGSLLGMKKHKKTCTGEKVLSNKGLPADLKTSMYVCPECDFYTISESSMKIHYKVCSKGKTSVACQTIDDYESVACLQLLNTDPLMILARASNKVSSECQTDPVRIMRNSQNEKVHCTSCSYSTTKPDKVSTECQTVPVKIVYDRHYCTSCNYSTTNSVVLKNHFRIHTGEKPFVCSFCEKRFGNKQAMVAHEKIHTGERPYTCDICSKTFQFNSTLKRHKFRKHCDERPFACNMCRSSFKFNYDLKIHMKSHKGFPATSSKDLEIHGIITTSPATSK